MAVKGYVATLLNALDPDIKKALLPVFDYIGSDWKLGDGDKANNALWYRGTSTTHATSGTEFSVAHGLGVAPTKLIPMLDLSTPGAQFVPLTTSKAADAKRIYLTSTSTGAQILFYLEA